MKQLVAKGQSGRGCDSQNFAQEREATLLATTILLRPEPIVEALVKILACLPLNGNGREPGVGCDHAPKIILRWSFLCVEHYSMLDNANEE
jgi:hypothetical protein